MQGELEPQMSKRADINKKGDPIAGAALIGCLVDAADLLIGHRLSGLLRRQFR